ncbi:MAG: hypothetical protein DCC74_06430 [Proteobacteria bacterium]|nr:MAG: hypothetical protein DCC74_06430 [Pseudomonadota bacterium]
MGNDNDTPEPAADAAPPPDTRRKREPPTIELEASEVKSEPGADAAPSEAASPPEAPPQPSDAPSSRFGMFAAALTGAVAALAVLAAVWLAGWPTTAPEPQRPAAADTTVTDALGSRLSTLEADFRTVAALPQASGGETADLVRRIAALEQAQGGLRQALAAEKSGAERLAATLDTLKSDIAALKAQPREATTAGPDLSALEARVTEIGLVARNAAATAATAATASQRPANGDAALRRAVTAAQLDAAVRQGTPYAALLAAAKRFEGDTATLAPLDAFADSGLPSDRTLGDDLLAVLPQLAPPQETPGAAAGLLERLQASATRLVRIRRDGPAEGDSRPAIVARAGAAAKSGDLDAAKRELMTLPAAERAPVAAWLARIDARQAALAASRSFAATAAAALAKPAP